MRQAWLASITAAVCAMGLAVPSGRCAPVDMAVSSHRAARPTAPAGAPTRQEAAWQAGAPRPSSLINPKEHPWQYFKAAMSEFPLASKTEAPKSANVVAQPVRPYNDAISLSTPVGPPTPQLLISTAQICERQGDVDGARRHFQQALNLWPGHVEVLRAAARMEDRQGNLPLAEGLYRQAVASNPQHGGALNDLGLCLAREGKLEQSIQQIELAINIQPDKPLFRNNAATVLAEMRQDQRALAHLAAVHNAADANYNLGQLLVQRGRPADAVAYFRAALEHNPQMQQAQVALAGLEGTSVANTACAPTYAPAQATQQAAPQVPTATTPQNPLVGPQLMKYPMTGAVPQFGTVPPIQPQFLPPVAQRPGTTPR
jgi:tetratricopeptide (TPR) repeat protein